MGIADSCKNKKSGTTASALIEVFALMHASHMGKPGSSGVITVTPYCPDLSWLSPHSISPPALNI
jgi:hypothetical protein